MSVFADYKDKSRILKLDREGGILTGTLHTDGASLLWGADDEDDYRLLDAFSDISDDPQNRVFILTGTGDSFCAGSAEGHTARYHHPESWEEVFRIQRKLHANFLEIDIPIIVALNGPIRTHSELPLMADIVLATDSTVFQDAPHFPAGIPPGDAIYTIWEHLIGPIRAKYFVLTGQEITATEALRLGAVNELLSKDRLLPRATELAEMIVARPTLTTQYTRRILNRDIRQRLATSLDHTLALEGLAVVQLRGWRMQVGGALPEWADPEWLGSKEADN